MRWKEDMNQYRGLVVKAVLSSNVPAIPVSILDLSKVFLSYAVIYSKGNKTAAIIILQEHFKNMLRYAAVPSMRRSTVLLAMVYGLA
jgi:Na+/H+ antiporter NhaC